MSIQRRYEKQIDREWENACNQYRHLENTRNIYLGFFFTIVFGLITVGVTLLKHGSSQVRPLIVLWFLTVAVGCITYVVSRNIKQLGKVRNAFGKFMNDQRRKAGVDDPLHNLGPIPGSLQNDAESVLQIGLWVLILAAIIIMAAVTQFGNQSGGFPVFLSIDHEVSMLVLRLAALGVGCAFLHLGYKILYDSRHREPSTWEKVFVWIFLLLLVSF